eukprot:10806818-Ditylum_brightwellii.AAC.1
MEVGGGAVDEDALQQPSSSQTGRKCIELCLHDLLCRMLRIGVVSVCSGAAGRTLAGIWCSSGGGIGFCTWCFATVCVGVDTWRCNLFWRARRQWQVAAVRQ